MDSSKPRKQRYFRFNAPMHLRQHFLHANVDKELRAKLGMKQRTVQISRGDTVKVMSGGKKKTTGTVTKVNLRTGRIFIDSLMRKNARGKEHSIGINASNVCITALNLGDKVRAAKLKLTPQAPVKEAKAQVQKAEKEAHAIEKESEAVKEISEVVKS